MTDDLDQLLAAPLPPLADDGFSAKLALRAHELNVRRQRTYILALAALSAAICIVMPFTPFGRAVDQWAMTLIDVASLPLAVAVGAVAMLRIVQQFLVD